MWIIVKGMLDASKSNYFPILGKGQDTESDLTDGASPMDLNVDLLV